MRRLLGRLPGRLLGPALAAVAAIGVLFARLARPVVLVRIGRLPSHEIGHYATNVEVHLCERDARVHPLPRRVVDLWYRHPGHPVANRQLDRMWARVIRILPTGLGRWLDAINRAVPGGAAHAIVHHDRDAHGLYPTMPPHLGFTAEERREGEEFLSRVTGERHPRFVCLAVRDAAYKRAQFSERDVHKDSYRNASIANYRLAVRRLADDGHWVFRMGAAVAEPLGVDHPRVVDYATNGMRTDFLDVYLGAHCAFCITTGLGIDSIPEIFRRPRLFTNYLPVANFGKYGPDAVILPKQYRLAAPGAPGGGRLLGVADLVRLGGLGGCTDAYVYEAAGISLEENTPEEILDAALEVRARLEHAWRDADGDEARQGDFWARYATLSPAPIRNAGAHRPRLGAAFLRLHPHWTAG
jgi:putative glycosyltransferase (TIGR04372 family)